MASYEELFTLKNNSALINRVQVACIVAAEMVMAELDTTPNHANRLLWAKDVFENPGREAARMYWAVLAANKDQDLGVITAATDLAIQSNVDEHIDLFATG